MDYSKLTDSNLSDLETMVDGNRISCGESVCTLHSSDQSSHPPCKPAVVIWPNTKEEVSRILSYANRHRIPVTAWGMGSSLEGNPIPVAGGIVLDFALMNRILKIREADFQADLEPGVIYQDLNERLRHLGLFFPPDPGARATIGGMVGNNSSGSRTVRYGATKDHIMRLVVALADGEIIEVGNRASKSSSGYDLLHLFIGSEGTLAITVEATVRLTPIPADFSAAVSSFGDVHMAAKAVFEIRRAGLDPAALELLSGDCINLVNQIEGLSMRCEPTLFIEFAGPSDSYLIETLRVAGEICKENGASDYQSGIGRHMRDKLFRARHALGEMIIRNHPGRRVFTTDVAVPISLFPSMIAFADSQARTAGLLYYLFSHAGDGNIHLVLLAAAGDEKELCLVRQVNVNMVEKALELGGTATGEHGVGIGKRQFMEAEHGRSLIWMRRLKTLFDPNGILNPGKILP